jgi:hypothetical protein
VRVSAVTEANARSIFSSLNSVGLEGAGVLVGRHAVAATLGHPVSGVGVGLGASAAQATITQAAKAAAPNPARPPGVALRIPAPYQMIMSEW